MTHSSQLRRPATLVMMLCITVGSLVGGYVLYGMTGPYSDGVLTEGTVTELERVRNSSGGDTYTVHYQFTTESGEVILRHDGFSSSSPGVGVGESVEVSYRPSDPYGSRRLGSGLRMFAYLLFATAAIPISIFTFVLIVSARTSTGPTSDAVTLDSLIT